MILKSLEKGDLPKQDLPEISLPAVIYERAVDAFVENCELSGGKVYTSADEINIEAVVAELYPNLRTILSYSSKVNNTVSLSEVRSGHELNTVELTVVEGELGVAENGAIWVDAQNLAYRSSLFICQHLVIILEKDKIVNNLHEAYGKLSFADTDFGIFISGPSKTADIEQALVIGAHGPRSCLVILI